MKKIDRTSGNARIGAWAPSHYRPPMIANSQLAFRSQMGFALPLAWGILARIGVPLLLTAGAIAGAGALIKSQVPSVPISKKNLGTSALVGGAGMAAYFMSDVIPEAWRPVSYALAAAGIAGSMYLLFTDVEEPPVAGETPVRPAKAAAPEAYAQVAAVFESPRQASEVGTGFGSQDYDVRISWVNNSRETVEFDHRFMILEKSSTVTGERPGVTKTVVPAPSRIRLGPGESLLRDYEIDAELMTGWVAANIEITVQVFNPHARTWVNVGSNFFRVVRWA